MMILRFLPLILKTTVVLSLLIGVVSSGEVFAQNPSADGDAGEKLFSMKCMSCHSLGGDDRIGPGLGGVVKRREQAWLKEFIQHPLQMIDRKDPVVMQLLEKYKMPMPDVGLTDEQTGQIVKYLESLSMDSPKSETITMVKREASEKNIAEGMALFQGGRRFVRQGPSCISCHDVRKASFFAGGSLAKDLTTSYSTLGEQGLAAILKNPPFPTMREAYLDKDLTDQEVSLIMDFLGNVDHDQKPVEYASKVLEYGILCLLILFLFFYFVIWAVGK